MAIYILILVAMVAFMFFMTRRQRQEQARQAALQKGLQLGDRVVTVSGLYGTIVDLDDATVDLEIAEEVVTTWLRGAIREVRTDTDHTTTHAADTAATEVSDNTSDEHRVDEHYADEHRASEHGIESVDPEKE